MRPLWYVISSFFVTAYYCLKVILASQVGVRLRPDGVYDQAAREWGRKLLRANGLNVAVQGGENIPDGPCVFVANHVSWVDVWALAALLPGRVRFLAKRGLFMVPFFGSALKRAGHIPIDRRNRLAAFDAYAEAVRLIQNGTRAIIFGEGTRSRDGSLQPLKKGPFVLAIQAGAPVVPVFIEGTFSVLPKGSMLLRPRPIAVLVGEPLPTDGLTYMDRESLGQSCRESLLALRDHVDGSVMAK
ncbi:MAG: lysophospholipid acyltransferase family protein [Gemmatimonadota bacterium]